MSVNIPCCLCGRTIKGVRSFFLHLINRHADAGFRFVYEDEDGPKFDNRLVVCCCGHSHPFPPPDWHPSKGPFTLADHLYNRGGLRRHLFDCLFFGEAEVHRLYNNENPGTRRKQAQLP